LIDNSFTFGRHLEVNELSGCKSRFVPQ